MISGLNSISNANSYVAAASKASAEETALVSRQTDSISFSPRALELMNRRQITEQERIAFSEIQQKAKEAGGYEDPKTFLKTLSPQEMEVLRKVHTLADPIKVAPLDFEGASNLLREPGGAKDLNNDGLLGVGIGKGWTFPPPNAPESVMKAWEEATAGMSEGEQWLMMGTFLAQDRFAHTRVDESGDAEFRSIYSDPDFAYDKLVDKILTQLEETKGYLPSDQYREKVSFLTTFKGALERNAVT